MEGQAGRARNARQRWILLAVVLLAFVLRVYTLGRAEFWFDEALSAAIAGKGWGDILAYTLNAPFEHPPVYYLALHSWLQLAGTSEFALRFFSLAWGVLFVPLVYRFLAPWGGQRFALLAAFVAAVSVISIDHSQNARMYTILPVLGVLSLIFFFRALTSRQLRWWAAYFAVIGLGIGVHYFFALMLLVPLTFVLLSDVRDRRATAPLILILLSIALLVAGWVWFSAGFREALQQILRGEGGGVSSLGLRIKHTVGGLLLEEPAVGHLALGALALVGVLFWPLPPPPRAHPVSRLGSRRFLLIWLLVPWLAALAVPYWLQDRHLSFLWPALYALIACGLLALRAKGRWLFASGLILILVTSGYGLWRQSVAVEDDFKFGQMMAFIEDRAESADLVILNQPGMWPYVDHYAQRDLDLVYLPATPNQSSEAEVDRRLGSLATESSRVWLGPIGAWTADPNSLVEQWLADHAYQAYKEWFAGSGSVALYFVPEPMEPLPISRVTWADRIRLRDARSSPLQVPVGDALLLRFDWQARLDLSERYTVNLMLVDDQGRAWAVRRSEPCGGLCPTDTWTAGHTQPDLHALLIPPGTPPGTYRLEVMWVPLDGDSVLPAEVNRERVEQVILTDVEILRPKGTDREPTTLPNPLSAVFGGEIALLGYEPATAKVRPGEILHLETHWRAETRPSDEYMLVVELVDRWGREVDDWSFAPSADFYPTSDWQPGEYVRGQHGLRLPSKLTPGAYRLRVSLANSAGEQLPLSGERVQPILGGLVNWHRKLAGHELPLVSLRVIDRSRQFKLPTVEHTLDATVGRQAHLVGYDLDLNQAHPGGQVRLTLYWQAGGPMVRPFKVFAHLVDANGIPRAQHDAPPGSGCCPADTWVEGEVVVDEHIIPLSGELPSGPYRLLVGMYDEEHDSRLPVYDASGAQLTDDFVAVGDLVVEEALATDEAGGGAGPQGAGTVTPEATTLARPRSDYDHILFLPGVCKGNGD